MSHMSAVTRRMIAVANEISTSGKGILAADESIPTMGKRFEKVRNAFVVPLLVVVPAALLTVDS
jgi:hypothetical protein